MLGNFALMSQCAVAWSSFLSNSKTTFELKYRFGVDCAGTFQPNLSPTTNNYVAQVPVPFLSDHNVLIRPNFEDNDRL